MDVVNMGYAVKNGAYSNTLYHRYEYNDTKSETLVPKTAGLHSQ